MDSYQYSHITLWWRGLPKSRYKLKAIYLHYHGAYGHQTWQDADLPWLTPTHEVTLPFGWRFTLKGSYHIVTWPFLVRWSYVDHLTVWKIYISTFAKLMATNFGRVLTTGRRFSTQTLDPCGGGVDLPLDLPDQQN